MAHKLGAGQGSGWAKSQATKIRAKSPLVSKVALRLLRTGGYLGSVREALKIEYRVLTRIVHSENFEEGVRVMFGDRDFWPEWRPPSTGSVTYDHVAKYFSPLKGKELALEPSSGHPLVKNEVVAMHA